MVSNDKSQNLELETSPKLSLVKDEIGPEEQALIDQENQKKERIESIEKEVEANFQKFHVFMTKSFESCVLMIKKWVNSGQDMDEIALRAISQQLSDEELTSLYEKISTVERQSWKNALTSFLQADKLIVANRYISEEIVREMIAPNLITDMELIDLLLAFDVHMVMKFADQQPTEIGTLMNLLNPKYTAKVIESLDEEKSHEVIEKSMEFDFEKFEKKIDPFKAKLTKFLDKFGKKPFNDKLLQMLPTFNPLKEKMIYKCLVTQGMIEDAGKAARNNFPSDLITYLPKELLKKMMQNYEMGKKVLLLSSVESEVGDILLNSFAEKGSASREMIDLEFDMVKKNPLAQSKIENQKDELWKDFVYYVREFVTQDTDFTSVFDQIISDWLTTFIETEQAEAS
jgi:hypothetical protein